MSKALNKRTFFPIIKRALLNELQIDKVLMKKMGYDGKYKFNIPRAQPSSSYMKLRCVMVLLIRYAGFVLMPLLFLKSFLTNIICSAWAYKSATLQPLKNKTFKHVVLDATPRCPVVISNILTDQESVLFIEFRSAVSFPGKTDFILLNRLISPLDCLRIFYRCFAVMCYWYKHQPSKYDFIQLYVVADLIKAAFGLNKILDQLSLDNAEILFANHQDRWATLFDGMLDGYRLTQVQHGTLASVEEIPCKLTHVKKVYAYDQDNFYNLKKAFLDVDEVAYSPLSITLDLSEIEEPRKTVLIVGHPGQYEKELAIYDGLIALDLAIYYKPHPLVKSSYHELKNMPAKLTFITDKGFYPRVGLVISPESTLGLEYESHTIPVVYHEPLSVIEIIERVKDITALKKEGLNIE